MWCWRSAAPGEVCIHTGFTESGQGFEALAIQAAAQASGLSEAVFTVRSGTAQALDSGPTLAGAERLLGLPAVEAAARALAAAPEQTLAALVGQTFAGRAAARRRDGLAAVLALLDPERGGTERLIAAAEASAVWERDPVGLRGQLQGALHMGLGAALSERRSVDAAGMPETQLRKLGVLKAKHTPPLEVRAVPGEALSDAAVVCAVPPAMAAALRAAGQEPGGALPMVNNPAAKAAGVRPPRRR